MPRISSRRSDGSEMELDGLAEQELLRLQQEYRIMEGDRKAYSEESQNIIRKQREAIAALQAENEELMKENRLAGSQQNETKDSQNIDKLSAMLHEEKELKKQIQLVKERIAMYDNEIYQNERNISQQRKGMGGVHMSQAKHVALQKQIRVLENRLDQGNRKFNQSLAKNSDLRNAIDHMITERSIFQGLHDKLEKRVKENKETIANIIEASTSSYGARDDAQNKMIALKEKSDKELLQYNMELKELLRIIDHDRKLREFMNIKSEDRVEMHGLKLNYTNNRGDEREKGGDKEDSIQCYENAFEQIKEATQIQDLQLLVGKFIETEDRNFALFNYVNELNNEIELMQERIADTESNIRSFKEESLNMDEERQLIMQNMEERNKGAEDEVATHESKVKAAEKMLTELKEGIQSLFTKINCDPSVIVDMLGGHAGITNGNLMQYLGIIEQRSNELIQVQAFVSNKETDSDVQPAAVSLLGKGPLPMPTPITVNPPTTGDEYDTDLSAQSDDENRPLTQQELRNRIVKGISKRENSKAEKEHRNVFSAEDPLEERTSTKKSNKTRSPMKEK